MHHAVMKWAICRCGQKFSSRNQLFTLCSLKRC